MPRTPRGALNVGLVIGAVDMGQRGLDYSTGDDPKTGAFLTRIELGLTLEWWGVLFILAAGAVLAGVVWHHTAAVASGAAAAAILYGALAVGRFDEIWESGWPPDGWRSALHFTCIALIWAYLSYQMFLRDAVEKDREVRRDGVSRAAEIAS
ncbi:hypothetical protein [Corynebacterium sp. 13CS0277]|uniref:hypothetical protein n=1 Tax=Corynebacterium sp. 13CS0277 TaxID=2071994 RepID=UPI0011B1CF55|nr:hypothetical protein [Corynebacterium sp. 13CS0277]